MINQEEAKKLKKGTTVHHCLNLGEKCEEFKVITPYREYKEGWLVECRKEDTSAGICNTRLEEWHLPGGCPPPSRTLSVSVYRVWDNKRVGTFYIGMDDSEKSLQENIPILLHNIQILARE